MNNRKTKILLTHGYFLSEDEKEMVIMKPYVPLGMLYISAWLEKNGFENEVFDSTFSDFVKLRERLASSPPDIIGIYTNLMTKLNVLKIIRMVKQELKLNTKIILGGPEVRHHAENFLRFGADLIVIGEGEETMLEVCRRFSDSGTLPEHIEGTAVFRNGAVVFNSERKLLRDLNELPLPARHKIDIAGYLGAWKNKHGYSQLSVSTMRGCPYTCKWCSRAVYGGTYRRRKAALVADEIEMIMQLYHPDKIWFVDDVFTISHKWLREFCDEIKQRQLRFSFEIITRADRMNEEVIQLLKQSGCFRIWIGAESGSQKIIDRMDRRVEAKQVREMIRLSRKSGIEAGTFIMLGYPGETRADIKDTIEHLIASQPDHFTITVAYPIKGTLLYSEVESKLISPGKWEQITDRELDFERTYRKRFYEFGVRWVYNSVAAARADSFVQKTRYSLKAFASQIMMALHK